MLSIVVNKLFKHSVVVSTMDFIEASAKFIPKFSASCSASDLLSLLVILEGIDIPYTFSLPIASASNTAQTLESSPPDNPKTARLNPHLEK